MDPNATLEEILDLLASAADEDKKFTMDDRLELLDKLADLHQWIAKGGFVPVVRKIGSHVCGDGYAVGKED